MQIAVALSAMGFLLTGLGACVAVLARDLHEPAGRLALLPSAFAVGLLVIAAVGPRLLRFLSITTVLAIGSAVCAFGGVLLALAPLYVVAIAGGLCIGLGGALLVLVAPLMLDGPTAAARLSRVNAVASATGILAPIAIGGVDSLGHTGRLALLAAVPPLLLLAALTGRRAAPPRSVAHLPEQHRATSSGPVAVAVSLGWLRVVLAVGVEFCFVVWAVARLLATGLPLATAALLGSAFPIGMAVGRAVGPIHWRGWPPVVPGGLLAIIGTLLVSLLDTPAAVTIGLVIAGMGVAPLYPVTLAALVATPGLNPTRLSAIGALASGTAILLTPAALAALARLVDLRTAYLITLPLIAILITLSRRTPNHPASPDLHPHHEPATHQRHPIETLPPRIPQTD
ncbi:MULTISPECIES: MFS transporter [unclassified Kribbella]|uniref:MFS transporter n=1 Tax=unclassified Kribbella TaxID=2644121 RepID=UPI00301B550C